MSNEGVSFGLSSHEVQARIEPGLRLHVRNGVQNVEYRRAGTLLTANRLDVLGKSRLLGPMFQGSIMARDMYLGLVKILTAGKYREAEDSSTRDYASSFLKLNASIREHGLSHDRSLVPVSPDGDIINGSHRVAIALAYGHLVPTVRINFQAPDYSATELTRAGCSQIILRQCVESFVEHCPTFTLIVWSSALGAFDRIVRQVPRVVHHEIIDFGSRGILRLIEACYFGESWIQDDKNALAQKRELVTGHGNIAEQAGVVIFQARSLDDVSLLKAELRSMFGNSPHSLHICDSQTEAVRIVRFALNRNSLHFARHSPLIGNQAADDILALANAALEKTGRGPNDIAIDGGAVMTMYGLRATSDLDVVVRDGTELSAVQLGVSQRSDSEMDLHGEPREALLSISELHFWHRDLKFVALHQVARMKRQRGEPKDVRDLALIGDWSPFGSIELTLQERWAYRKYWARNRMGNALRRLGLHATVRTLVLTLRGFRTKQ